MVHTSPRPPRWSQSSTRELRRAAAPGGHRLVLHRGEGPPRTPSKPHVLIIVENLPVPLDRRVWLECQALKANGYEVSVICPEGPGDPPRQTIEGIDTYKYRPAPEANGLARFALEFAYCWIRAAVLSIAVARHRRISAIQACNPPDTYWLLSWFWRPLGVRFVFDQHDLDPELFLSRFGAPHGATGRTEYAGLLWLERMTYRSADRVLSTNESYKRIALDRGDRDPRDVTVVRSGPDTRTMRPIYPTNPRPAGHTELVYVGIMGPQDGVDNVLRVMDELVHRRGRHTVHATLMGFGDSYDSLRKLASDLHLDEYVTFTGRADRRVVAENLSRADIGVGPDLKTPLNDVSSMNKTMEYMAFALPSVSFDLLETRVSGGDSVLYVESGNIARFADAVETLADDPDLRVELGRRARDRAVAALDWRPQAEAYVSTYDDLLGVDRPAGIASAHEAEDAARDEWGNLFVPLDDPDELARFIVERRSG